MKEGEPTMPKPKLSLETRPQEPITEAELKSETSNSLNKNTAPAPAVPRASELVRLLTFANVNKNKRIERVNIEDSRNYLIGLRVLRNVYEKWHSLDRDRKRVLRQIFESLVLDSDKLPQFAGSLVINLNANVNQQVVIVEKQGVKELKEKLKKYDDFEKCVRAVLIGKYLNWDKQLQLCFEKLK
jgi:hypothetical protein